MACVRRKEPHTSFRWGKVKKKLYRSEELGVHGEDNIKMDLKQNYIPQTRFIWLTISGRL